MTFRSQVRSPVILVQHYVYNKFYTKSEVSKAFLLRAIARDGRTDRRGATLSAAPREGHQRTMHHVCRQTSFNDATQSDDMLEWSSVKRCHTEQRLRASVEDMIVVDVIHPRPTVGRSASGTWPINHVCISPTAGVWLAYSPS